LIAIDTKTYKPMRSVNVGDHPWGLAFSPGGKRLYTANGPSDDVSIVDVASFKVRGTVSVGQRPWGVAVIQ
jgi:YVTN family beta-propeller protein